MILGGGEVGVQAHGFAQVGEGAVHVAGGLPRQAAPVETFLQDGFAHRAQGGGCQSNHIVVTLSVKVRPVRAGAVPHHPPGTLFFRYLGIDGESLVVGIRRPAVIVQINEVVAAVEPGEILLAGRPGGKDSVGSLGSRAAIILVLTGILSQQGHDLGLLLRRVDDDVHSVEMRPVIQHPGVGDGESGIRPLVRIKNPENGFGLVVTRQQAVMPHPAVEAGAFEALFHHHGITGGQHALEQVEIAADAPYRLQVGHLVDEGGHFVGHDVLVARIGLEISGGIPLVALPPPEGKRHREGGRPAVVPLLVFVTRPFQKDLLRQQGGGRRRGWRGQGRGVFPPRGKGRDGGGGRHRSGRRSRQRAQRSRDNRLYSGFLVLLLAGAKDDLLRGLQGVLDFGPRRVDAPGQAAVYRRQEVNRDRHRRGYQKKQGDFEALGHGGKYHVSGITCQVSRAGCGVRCETCD